VELILHKIDNFFSFCVNFPDILDKDEFAWIPYLNYNKDLVPYNLISCDKVCKHWEEYGLNEVNEKNRIINGSLGIITSRGVISKTYLNSLHYIAKIKSLLEDRIADAVIYDVNGGIGISTFYLKKMGVKKIFLINKPEYCLVSSYYLSNVLGDDNITLYNESALYDESTENTIVILPIFNYVKFLDNIHYFLICEDENLRVINKHEFDPRDFDKKYFLIAF